MNWIEITKESAMPVVEVLGFNKEWIDEDYNPDGICMCFTNDGGVTWTVSKWCGYHDEWHTRHTDEDIEKEHYEKQTVAPTHYMYKPQKPA